VNATEDEIVAQAKRLEPVAREIEGKPVKRAIVAKRRLVNLVI
jgi:hypothetical protein